MRVVSWNVNGLRACAREAFPRFLRESAADVIGVQEVRALPGQLDVATRSPEGWHACFAPGGPGYSGVAIYSPAGQLLGKIAVPVNPRNLAFGDADMKTLYLVGNSVFKVRVDVAGSVQY